MRSLLLGAAMVALMAPAAFAQSMDGADAPIMEGPGRYLVFFPWDKATLTADDQRIVAQAAEEFRQTGSARIDVTGYTDTSGSAEYNLRLSERRAQMVASELERQGVAATEMVVIGRGEENLRIPTADGVREAGNRRVEIVFAVPEAAPAAEPVAEAPAPEPMEEVAKRFTFTLGALYGHNFGELDESGTDDKTENDLVGAELTFDALPGDIVGLSLKQAILYSFNGDRRRHQRPQRAQPRPDAPEPFGVPPLSQRQFRRRLRFGRPGRPRRRAGAGLQYRPDRRHPARPKVAYDYQFRNSDWDRGIAWGGLDLGYRF